MRHRHDVGARQHDVVDAPLAQIENVAQQAAFGGREAGDVGSFCTEDGFEIGAQRAGFPAEHRADDAPEPALAIARDLDRARHGNGEVSGRLSAPVRVGLWHG